MVICMDSSISSTAFTEHLFSLVPRPASCALDKKTKKSVGTMGSNSEEMEDLVSFLNLSSRRHLRKNTLSKSKETELEQSSVGVALIGQFFLDRCFGDILLLGARAPSQGCPHEWAPSSAWSPWARHARAVGTSSPQRGRKCREPRTTSASECSGAHAS